MHITSIRSLFTGFVGAFALAGAVHAGVGDDLTILFVSDPDLDQVFRLQDLNEDGDYNDPGEAVVFYDGQTGPFLLQNPITIAADPFDQVFVGDSAAQRIFAFRDDDDSGDANGTGESRIFFDGTPGGNASGIVLANVQCVTTRILGTVWVTDANTNGSNFDRVIRLRDANNDGDANDVAEAFVYYTGSVNLPVDASILSSIEIGLDGLVYVLENGTGGVRGLHRLLDLNDSGSIDAPGEVQTYWIPTQAVPGDFTSAEVGAQGEWYVLDRANQVVQIGFDVDVSGSIQPTGEAAPFWQILPNQVFYDMAVTVPGGELFLGDVSGSSNLITFVQDLDMSNAIDGSSEVFSVYDDTIATVNIDNPYSLTVDFHDHEAVGDAFCSASPLCPCGNGANSDTGCASSLGIGAQLLGFETDGVANDDLLLTVLQLPPNVPVLLYVGNGTVNGGIGAPFGDGLRCVEGGIVRLGVRFANGVGTAQWGPGFAAQLGLSPGDTRYFQAWYRNNTGPCGTGFNLTNGLQINFTQ